MELSFTTELMASTVRMAVPLILACIAGLWSEKSGIVDIGLEGKMLVAAFAAAAGTFFYQSAWVGLGLGILASVAFALIHGYAAISQRGNQVISGFGINFLAAGLTVVLGHYWFKEGGRTPMLPPDLRFLPLDLPVGLTEIPVLGAVVQVIFGQSVLAYIAFLTVPLSAWALARTRFGLRLRAVGENPHAVDTAGISVARLRYQAVIIAGVLCGIAGAYLSISLSAGFGKDMTAGRGYMALAALIFASWRPWPAMWACLLFGFLQAMGNYLQGAELFGAKIPVQAFNVLPYVMTVVLLAGFIGKSVPPKASGIPYTKDR